MLEIYFLFSEKLRFPCQELLTPLRVILHTFCCLLIFFLQNPRYIFEKFFQECHKCQKVWIQIRPDVLSCLNFGPNCLQRLLADNTCRQRHEFTISLSMLNECEARVKIWMFQSTR